MVLPFQALFLHHWRISASASPVEASRHCFSCWSRCFPSLLPARASVSLATSVTLLNCCCCEQTGMWERWESWCLLQPGDGLRAWLGASNQPLPAGHWGWVAVSSSEAYLTSLERREGRSSSGFVNKANLGVAGWLKSASSEDRQALWRACPLLFCCRLSLGLIVGWCWQCTAGSHLKFSSPLFSC